MTLETISRRYRGLDTWSDAEVLEALWEGQARAVAVLRAAMPAISDAAGAMVERIEPAGRIVYAGAGSSGQLAALDGMELRATFGWPKSRVGYLLAERLPALVTNEAGEDDIRRATAGVRQLELGTADTLIAVAASGTTPFTVAAAKAARESGALVVTICNNSGVSLLNHADHCVVVETGAEVIAGSTRMNAGTAQKAVLNMLSTLVMTRLGRVHDGLMVDMPVDRQKFSRRAIAVVSEIAECSQKAASQALAACEGRIKPAVLVQKGASLEEADALLAGEGNNLRQALTRLSLQMS